VWLFAVVITVFTGYGERIKESIFGFEPHLVIDSGRSLEGWREVREKISAVGGVVSVTPFVRGQVVMDFNKKRLAPTVRGILPPEGEELRLMRAKMAKDLPAGDFDLTAPDSAVLGVGLGLAELTLFFRNDLAAWLGQNFGVGFFTDEAFKVDGGLPAKRTLRDMVIIATGAFAPNKASRNSTVEMPISGYGRRKSIPRHAFQSFPGQPLSQAEAHLCLHHHGDLHPRSGPRGMAARGRHRRLHRLRGAHQGEHPRL
jgi:hypothetical protein